MDGFLSLARLPHIDLVFSVAFVYIRVKILILCILSAMKS